MTYVRENIIEDSVLKKKEELLKIVKMTHMKIDAACIESAFYFAYNAHKGQFRKSKEPYITHAIAVAKILAEEKFDAASIITALLHDTLEDTVVSYYDIKAHFGDEIARIVEGVTKLNKVESYSFHTQQVENFRKLLLAISEDIRVLIVKLADRMHNMQTLHYIVDKQKRIRIAHETIEIYAPIAERMGMHKFKNILQDLSLKILHPNEYHSIEQRMSFITNQDDALIQNIQDNLEQKLLQKGITSTVIGRAKTVYSVRQKMKKKAVSFDQLSDIIGFRILVATVEECYLALCIIHTTYKVIISGFKDYISLPKANGYQSIHTLVFGIAKQRIEVQIRTWEMHENAEFGVASHWLYKQGRVRGVDSSKFQWIRELVDLIQKTSSTEEFIENTKLEMYNEQVFCFTIDGVLIQLPKGATPIDFAFSLHSRMGLACIGAKINGCIASLNTKLKNGDQVEIITSKTPNPSLIWENFVVTSKAKSSLRRFFNSIRRNELINCGRIALLQKSRIIEVEYNEQELLSILSIFKKKNVDDLLYSIGEGSIDKLDVLNALYNTSKHNSNFEKKIASLVKKRKKQSDKVHDVEIYGIAKGAHFQFANCCMPIPGDKIIGITNDTQDFSKEIIVHSMNCEVLDQHLMDPKSFLNLSWCSSKNYVYTARILLSSANQSDILVKIINVFINQKCNVVSLKVSYKLEELFDCISEIQVKGLAHLEGIISELYSIPEIFKVKRMITLQEE